MTTSPHTPDLDEAGLAPCPWCGSNDGLVSIRAPVRGATPAGEYPMTLADELLATLKQRAARAPGTPYTEIDSDLDRRVITLIRTLIAERDEARAEIERLKARLGDPEGVIAHADALTARAEKAQAALATAREEGRREGAALNADQAVKEAYEKGRREMAEEAARIFEGVSHEVEPHIICEAIRQAAQTEGGGR